MAQLALTLATLAVAGTLAVSASSAKSLDDLMNRSSFEDRVGPQPPIGTTARQQAGPLLDQLKTAPDRVTARDLEARIAATWSEFGNAQIDELNDRALMYLRAQDVDSALAILDAIVTKAPDFAEGWNRRASLLFNMHHYDQALNDYAHALSLEPRHFGALAGVALVRAAQGDKVGAAKALQLVLRVDPQNQGARYSLAMI